jgi:hypothetical protein
MKIEDYKPGDCAKYGSTPVVVVSTDTAQYIKVRDKYGEGLIQETESYALTITEETPEHTEIKEVILKKLTEKLEKHEAIVAKLKQDIGEIYRERRKTCKHPDMESSPYAHWCDYCGYYRDRSF